MIDGKVIFRRSLSTYPADENSRSHILEEGMHRRSKYWLVVTTTSDPDFLNNRSANFCFAKES